MGPTKKASSQRAAASIAGTWTFGSGRSLTSRWSASRMHASAESLWPASGATTGGLFRRNRVTRCFVASRCTCLGSRVASAVLGSQSSWRTASAGQRCGRHVLNAPTMWRKNFPGEVGLNTPALTLAAHWRCPCLPLYRPHDPVASDIICSKLRSWR